jgi:hypothetical protein
MKSVLALRVAAVLGLIHAVLHTVGGVYGSMPPGPATVALEAMKTNPFPFFGVTRTFWDFHHGMGLMVTIFLTDESIVFWQFASLAKSATLRLRPILTTFLIAYVALAIISLRYFFLIPVITEILIAACFAWAIAAAKSPVTA